MIIKSGLNLSQRCACVPSYNKVHMSKRTQHQCASKTWQSITVPDIPQEHFEHESHQLKQSLLQPVHLTQFLMQFSKSTRYRTPKHLVPAPWHGNQCYSPGRGAIPGDEIPVKSSAIGKITQFFMYQIPEKIWGTHHVCSEKLNLTPES